MSIVDNRKAFHKYFVEERYEAGIALQGWEVKSIRAGKAQISEAYVKIIDGEIVLFGAHITPLITATNREFFKSSKASGSADPTRIRSLLLHKKEISKLIGKVERAGYTLIPLNLHFSKSGKIKLEIGLAKGKKQHDKRAAEKDRDSQREAQQAMKKVNHGN